MIAPDGSIVAIYMAVDGAGIVPIAENSEGIGFASKMETVIADAPY